MKWLAPLLILLTGCVHYKHESKTPDYTGTNFTVDTTSFYGFLYVGSAGKIRSDVKQNGTNYSRLITVGQIQGKGDTELVEALAAGMMRGAVEAGKKSAGVP